MLDLQIKPKIKDIFRLQFEKTLDCYVLLYPEGMIKLNQSSSAILNYCDSKNSIENIITYLIKDFGDNIDIKNDVITFIQQAYDKKWLI